MTRIDDNTAVLVYADAAANDGITCQVVRLLELEVAGVRSISIG